MKIGLLKIVSSTLHNQAQEINPNSIKDKVAVKLWKIVVDVAKLFSEDLTSMGSDIGRIIAYRYQEDEEFKEEVNKIIREIKKLDV